MRVPTVEPQEVQRLREEGKPLAIIDVRSPAEYQAVHAEGARLAPLDKLDPELVCSGSVGDAGNIYLICASGSRAAKAWEKFRAAGISNVANIAGGTAAWERAGLPVVRGETSRISLERQVRIGAGLLVLLGVILGWIIHPALSGISAFIGAGLVLAGITDWCGMAMLLAKMPWNRCGASVGQASVPRR